MSNASDLVRCVGFDEASDSWFNDCGDYLNGAAGAAAPGALFLVLLLLVAVWYVLAQCCGLLRCICRGCKLPREGATEQSVRLHRVLVWAAVVALATVAVICSTSNQSLRTAMEELQQEVSSVKAATMQTAHSATSGVQGLAETARTREAWRLEQTVSAAEGSVIDWAKVMRTVEKNLTRYLWAVDATLWLTVAVLLCFAVTTLLNVHRVVPLLSFFVVLLVGGCVMCLQGVVGITSDFAASTCAQQLEVQDSLDSFFASSHFRNTSVVEVVTALPQNVDSVYTAAMNPDGFESWVGTLCHKYFDCPAACGSAQCVAGFLAHTAIRAGVDQRCTGQCTILQCAEECSNEQVRRSSAAVVRVVQAYNTAALAAVDAAAKIGGAELFTAGVALGLSIGCTGDLQDALKALSRLLAAASVITAAAAVLVCLATYIYHGTKAGGEREVIVVGNVTTYSGEQPAAVLDDTPIQGTVINVADYDALPADVEANAKAKAAAL